MLSSQMAPQTGWRAQDGQGLWSEDGLRDLTGRLVSGSLCEQTAKVFLEQPVRSGAAPWRPQEKGQGALCMENTPGVTNEHGNGWHADPAGAGGMCRTPGHETHGRRAVLPPAPLSQLCLSGAPLLCWCPLCQLSRAQEQELLSHTGPAPQQTAVRCRALTVQSPAPGAASQSGQHGPAGSTATLASHSGPSTPPGVCSDGTSGP